jgi:hypothetical protein
MILSPSIRTPRKFTRHSSIGFLLCTLFSIGHLQNYMHALASILDELRWRAVRLGACGPSPI